MSTLNPRWQQPVSSPNQLYTNWLEQGKITFDKLSGDDLLDYLDLELRWYKYLFLYQRIDIEELINIMDSAKTDDKSLDCLMHNILRDCEDTINQRIDFAIQRENRLKAPECETHSFNLDKNFVEEIVKKQYVISKGGEL